MTQDKKEIVETNNDLQVTGTPSDLIRMAITSGADLDKLEKLLTLQERWDANEAKKAYNQAMAIFKADPPQINKDKKVAYKEVRYSHASLANVTDKINTALSKHGLSASWTTRQDGQIFVTCRITHKLGHTEETTLSAGADTTGSKNSIQAIGSTVTYLQRYTLLALTGLATFDQDDDAICTGAEMINEYELANIETLISEVKANMVSVLKYAKVENLDQILKSDYKKIIAALESKRK